MRETAENPRLATELARSIERACVAKDPTELVRHLAKQAVWRDDGVVYVGRGEIWNGLNEKWALSLICTTKLQIEDVDSQSVRFRLNSEWQHASCGRWFRTETSVRVTVDDRSRVSTVESTNATETISAADRRLAIPMPTTSESIR